MLKIFFRSILIIATLQISSVAFSIEEPQVRWEAKPIEFTVDSDRSEQTLQLQAQQIMTYTTSQTANVVPNNTVEVEVAYWSKCPVYTCTGSGQGKSPLWDAFYSASAEDKVTALDKAILGAGPETSKKLVMGQYFAQKPRSWDHFVKIIQQAQIDGAVRPTEATKILSQENYGLKNLRQLGYSENSCRITQVTCTKYTKETNLLLTPQTQSYVAEKVIGTVSKKVKVFASGSKLLPYEKDSFTLEIGKDLNDLKITGSNDNKNEYEYGIYSDQIVIKAIARKKMSFPRDVVLSQSYTYNVSTGEATLTLNLDKKYFTEPMDANSTLLLNYRVQTCNYGWTGTCGLESWKDVAQSEIKVTKEHLVITIPAGTIKAKQKSQVVYTFTKLNSPYYSSRPTSEFETEEVKTPKN
ncbi:MAG: hypothetical protein ACOYOK_11005 [Pseudobdellovibrionaceae bacterium]